jgi:hypothetical protein
MRGVGVRGSLLAGVSTIAILLAAESPAIAAADEAPAEVQQAKPSQDDYYTRRAKDILKSERAARIKPHPLAAAYPDLDVVVCEAGCPDRRGPEIVYGRPHVATTETREGLLLPTSGSDATLGGASSPGNVACIAGCYSGSAAQHQQPIARRPPRVERMALPSRDKLSPIR